MALVKRISSRTTTAANAAATRVLDGAVPPALAFVLGAAAATDAAFGLAGVDGAATGGALLPVCACLPRPCSCSANSTRFFSARSSWMLDTGACGCPADSTAPDDARGAA